MEDMIKFALKIQSYTSGLDQADFISKDVTYDATLRNLELIGEASPHIPKEIQSAIQIFPGD